MLGSVTPSVVDRAWGPVDSPPGHTAVAAGTVAGHTVAVVVGIAAGRTVVAVAGIAAGRTVAVAAGTVAGHTAAVVVGHRGLAGCMLAAAVPLLL